VASKLANGSKYKDSWGRLTHLKTGIKRVTLKTMPRLNKLPLKQRHKSIQRRRSPWLRWFKRNCNSGQDLTRTKPRACQPFEVLEKVKTTVSILPFLPPLFSCGALIDLQSEGCGEGEGTLVLVLPVPGCCLRGVTTASSWQRKCTLHRCDECLTKNYCIEGLKHRKFCPKGAEERKVKQDSKTRVETGLKRLDDL